MHTQSNVCRAVSPRDIRGGAVWMLESIFKYCSDGVKIADEQQDSGSVSDWAPKRWSHANCYKTKAILPQAPQCAFSLRTQQTKNKHICSQCLRRHTLPIVRIRTQPSEVPDAIHRLGLRVVRLVDSFHHELDILSRLQLILGPLDVPKSPRPSSRALGLVSLKISLSPSLATIRGYVDADDASTSAAECEALDRCLIVAVGLDDVGDGALDWCFLHRLSFLPVCAGDLSLLHIWAEALVVSLLPLACRLIAADADLS